VQWFVVALCLIPLLKPEWSNKYCGIAAREAGFRSTCLPSRSALAKQGRMLFGMACVALKFCHWVGCARRQKFSAEGEKHSIEPMRWQSTLKTEVFAILF
jgi:hypothetical protein